MNNEELMTPAQAAKELNAIPTTLMALANSTYLEIQHGFRVINGESADYWFKKNQVMQLKGLDHAALIGFRGSEKMLTELKKFEERLINDDYK